MNKDKKSWQNTLLVLGIVVVIFFIVISITDNSVNIDGNNNSNTEEISEKQYKRMENKLEQYEWGNKLAPILKEMGVKKIKNIKVDSDEKTGTIYGVTFTADDTELKTHPVKNSDGWEILWVSNADHNLNISYGANYYLTESLKYDSEGRLLDNIYDYKTKTIIETTDEAIVAEKEKDKDKLNEEKETSEKKKKDEQSKKENLSEEDYKAMCKDVPWGEVVNSDKSYVGSYLKKELMVRELAENIETKELVYICGEKKDENSYVGGTFTVSDRRDNKDRKIELYDIIYVYGEITQVSERWSTIEPYLDVKYVDFIGKFGE